MPTYRLSQKARRDLVEIWSYIAPDSEEAADRFTDLVVGSFKLLGQNPYLGRSRDDLRPASAVSWLGSTWSFTA